MILKDVFEKVAKLNGKCNEKRLIIEYFGSVHNSSYIQEVKKEIEEINSELEKLLNTEVILKG